MIEPGLVVYVVIGVVMVLGGSFVLWKCPELMIAVLLAGQDFIQSAFAIFGITIGRKAFAMTGSILFGTAVLVLGFGHLLGLRTARPAGTRVHWWIILMVALFGVFTAVGLAYTEAPDWGMRIFVDYLTFGAAPFVLCFLLIRDLNGAKRLLFWVIILVAIYVVLVSGYTLVTHGTLIGQYRYGEAGTFLGVEVQGALILQKHMLVLFAALMGWFAMTRRWWAKWVIPLGVALVILYIIMSSSRTGLLTLGVFAFMAPVLIFRRRVAPALGLTLLLILLTVVMLAMLPEEATERILEPLVGTSEKAVGGSGLARLRMWDTCLEMIVSAPITGYGTGGFAMYYAHADAPLFPHSMFLQIFAENGVFAFATLCVFWWLVFYYPYQIWKRHRKGEVIFGLVIWTLLLLTIELLGGMLHAGVTHAQSKALLAAGIAARLIMLVAQEERQEADKVTVGTKLSGTSLLEPVHLLRRT